VAFCLLGAATLGRLDMVPEGSEMIRTLSVMYEPVFGSLAKWIFLIGAFSVLFSTFFVANAQNGRLAADALKGFGFKNFSEQERGYWVRRVGVFFPIACLIIYLFVPKPVTLIFVSGLAQSLLLPMLGFAALYYRYKSTIESLKPGKLWDAMLWISFAGFLLVGGYLLQRGVSSFFG